MKSLKDISNELWRLQSKLWEINEKYNDKDISNIDSKLDDLAVILFEKSVALLNLIE